MLTTIEGGRTDVPAPKPTEPKLRTITLTNRAPIQIVEDEWPVIAEGKCAYECPGGADISAWSISVMVRREIIKTDPVFKIQRGGRTIIHAKYGYWDENDEENVQTVRVGRLLDEMVTADEYWKAIVAVGNELRERIQNDHLRKRVTLAVDHCFAKLKPQKNY